MLNADDKFSWHLVEQPPFQIGASICILLPIHRRPANPRRHFGCIPRCWHQYWVIIYSVPAVLYTQPCRGLGTVKIPFTSILCNFFLVFKYIFLTPEVYIRGPVSSLLGFYSIWSNNIQVQPLNGQPLFNLLNLRELVFPTWFSRSLCWTTNRLQLSAIILRVL